MIRDRIEVALITSYCIGFMGGFIGGVVIMWLQ